MRTLIYKNEGTGWLYFVRGGVVKLLNPVRLELVSTVYTYDDILNPAYGFTIVTAIKEGF